MTTATAQTLEIPLSIYDVASGGIRSLTLYFDAKKSRTGDWYDLMLEAQRQGKRFAYSSEWFNGRRYLEQNNPQAEEDFITGVSEWTGTVLDYEQGALLEGITLDPDKSIASVKTRLGKKEGILLPPQSAYVKDLDDKYMALAIHLWGVQDPKRELPDYAYLYVSHGFRPVVRGGWGWDRRDYGRVGAGAGYGAAGGGFAARFVSETKPVELQVQAGQQEGYRISKADYNALVAIAKGLGADDLLQLLSMATLIE